MTCDHDLVVSRATQSIGSPKPHVHPQARALLETWATTHGVPVERLTATQVRREDLAVLDLQATPDRLHAVDDIEVPGPEGAMATRSERPPLSSRLSRAHARAREAGAGHPPPSA